MHELFMVKHPIVILLKRMFKNAQVLVHPFLQGHGIGLILNDPSMQATPWCK